MEKVFNKLVRDKIPEIIENNNEIPTTRILTNEEYKKELLKKLLEEYNEVLKENNKEILEELADMLEVIDAIARNENSSLEEIMRIKDEKKQKRGGFSKKILLIKTNSRN